VNLVFGDPRLDRRNLGDLMANRLRIVSFERTATVKTLLWFARNDLVHFVRLHESPGVLGMAFLAAPFTSRRTLGRLAFVFFIRRIGGRRTRRIRRVLLCLGLQFANFRLQIVQPRQYLLDHRHAFRWRQLRYLLRSLRPILHPPRLSRSTKSRNP